MKKTQKNAQLVDFGDVARVDRVSFAKTRVRRKNGVVVAGNAQHRAESANINIFKGFVRF